MSLKFTSNLTSRVSTVSMERQLLHLLLCDRCKLQTAIGKHRSDFFTSQSRLFIYDCINRTFNEKHCVLERQQFEFEIQKRFDSLKDKDRIDDFMSEFDIIKKTSVNEGMDVILQNLEEVQLANSAESLIREAYSKLESGDYSEAVDILRKKSIDLGTIQKENRIYNLHADNEDWFEEVRKRKEHPEIYAGIPTGFKEFDEKTGGLFPAELTVVFGLSGKGKSTLMKAIGCNVRKTGRNVLHCGNEENEFQMRSKYMSADSGALYTPFKRGTYTDDEYAALKKYSDHEKNAKGGIYIYEFPQQTDATWIERAYHQLEMQGIHIDLIIVDYLDLMKPCEKAYSENDEGGKVTSDLKQVAINCNCPVVTATQAGIQSEKQETKEKPFLNQSDVFGTKRKVHSANTLIGIVNQTATAQANELGEERRQLHHLVLCVPKNRDGAIFTFRQVMYTPSGQFAEDDHNSNDEQLLQEIARQALKMCDDTLLPGQMVSEISLEQLNNARTLAVNTGVEKLKQELENERNKNVEQERQQMLQHDGERKDNEVSPDDPLLGECVSGVAVEEQPTLQNEQPADIEEDFLNVEDEGEPCEPAMDDEQEEPPSPVASEPPSPTTSEPLGVTQSVEDGEPLIPFDQGVHETVEKPASSLETDSSHIAHKRSFSEIMAEKASKGERL